MSNWQFAWGWLAVLLPLPVLVRWLWPRIPAGNQAALRPPAEADFLALDDDQRAGDNRRRLLLLALIWSLLVAAAMRPQHLGDPISLPLTGRDLMLAVDLSGSMEERDFQLNGSRVDRLTASKAVASDFIARRVGDRVGLILFGRNAYVQTPLTFDRDTVKILLSEAAIGLAGKETAIGDAIGLGLKTLTAAGVDEGRRVLVLMTDGANTAGEVQPLKAAELAAQRGMVIYTIGIGADEMFARSLFGTRRINPSRDLDEKTLTAIAEQTGGAYFRARDTQELANIYAQLDELEPAAEETSGFRPVTELFLWPLATALLISLAWFGAALLESRGGGGEIVNA